MCVRSVCLLLQVALPCALYADAASQLCLKGGTNAEMAPQIDYTVKVPAHMPCGPLTERRKESEIKINLLKKICCQQVKFIVCYHGD